MANEALKRGAGDQILHETALERFISLKGGADDDNDDDDKDNVDLDELQHGCSKEEFREAGEVYNLIKSLPETFHDQILYETALERFIFIIDQYQEQPHLLDPHLAKILDLMLSIVRDPKSHRDLVHMVFKYMYYVTKTRGFKVIIRLMPHEVVDLEPILNLLQEQNPEDSTTWESRYMLLVWLSIVCMIPFDLDRLNKKQGTGSEVVMMDMILDSVKPYLGVFDKSRDAAAYLIARFLTRPDVKERRLGKFTDWAIGILNGVKTNEMSDMYWIYGLLNTFGLLFKHGKREDLLDVAPKILNKLTDLKLMELNTGLRKLHIKVIQRLGLGFLKPRLASWRYQRGNRSLAENLSKKNSASDTGTVGTTLASNDDEEYDIPEELESIIEELLGGLKDKDTIVRWSAAKGVGRLSGRLPRELADEVLASILDLFSELAGDEPWHGGCLALAELGRRGLLLPDRLNEVIPIVLKALRYDEKRGNFSVGSHVRDAACYVCWAFARAYDPKELAPHVQHIASALVICSILDRDVNVRRAAAAAFQENVGRQGQFPHGIDILTTCDYFAVGSRRRCYNELSLFIGQYTEYITTLIDHLVEVKLVHWDIKIREYSAIALENLSPKATDYLAHSVLPVLATQTLSYDLAVRHGSTVGLGHIIYGLSLVSTKTKKSLSQYLTKDVQEAVETVIQEQTDGKLFKGISGATLRVAAASLIQKCSKAGVSLPDNTIEAWRTFLEDCLYHTGVEVREGAVNAFKDFLSRYYVMEKFMPYMDKYLRELTGHTEITRQGFALAVGQWPKFVLRGSFRMILSALMLSITSTKLDQKQAEARRDAVIALSQVCTTVGVNAEGSPQECVCPANIGDIYETLFVAIRDYTIDPARGDSGSYIREASMEALSQITSLTVTAAPALITPVIAQTLICQLLQQANEKICRTRGVAGDNLMRMLYHLPPIPHVPDIDLLRTLFPRPDANHPLIIWEMASSASSLFAKLLSHPIYVKPVLQGFIITVGGLTEYILLHSRTALFAFLKQHRNDRRTMDLVTNSLLDIFDEYARDGRVTIPALKTLDQLLDNDCFATYSDDVEFPLRLLNTVKKELSKVGDPNKLLAAVDVYCGMIQFQGEVRNKSLFSLMLLLCHKYPTIRKKTANKLYETLLSYDDICDEIDNVMTILSETLWDNDLEEIRPIRNNLCDLLGVQKPVLKNLKAGN